MFSTTLSISPYRKTLHNSIGKKNCPKWLSYIYVLKIFRMINIFYNMFFFNSMTNSLDGETQATYSKIDRRQLSVNI